MLTITEVRQLFGLTNPDEFEKFLAEQPLFTRPVRLGKTANTGRPLPLLPCGEPIAELL
jgi:hypothetical protein